MLLDGVDGHVAEILARRRLTMDLGSTHNNAGAAEDRALAQSRTGRSAASSA